MKEELQRTCELFVSNRNTIKKMFKWDDDLMALAGSTIFTGMNTRPNEEKLKECEQILKTKTGALSEFRGNAKIPILCQMVLAPNPQQYLENVVETYRMMNPGKIIGSDSKLMAAVTISSHCGLEETQHYVDQMEQIYSRMKQEHKWLTSSSDIPFAAMLAVSDMDVDKLVQDMEECFTILRSRFSGEASQSLSHVLSVCKGTPQEKCSKILEIYDGLKAAKHKFGAYTELAALGVFADLDEESAQIIQDIVDADIYLKAQKGFGDLALGSETRRMYAALTVMNSYHPDNNSIVQVAMGSTLALTVTLEVIMLIILIR